MSHTVTIKAEIRPRRPSGAPASDSASPPIQGEVRLFSGKAQVLHSVDGFSLSGSGRYATGQLGSTIFRAGGDPVHLTDSCRFTPLNVPGAKHESCGIRNRGDDG